MLAALKVNFSPHLWLPHSQLYRIHRSAPPTASLATGAKCVPLGTSIPNPLAANVGSWGIGLPSAPRIKGPHPQASNWLRGQKRPPHLQSAPSQEISITGLELRVQMDWQVGRSLSFRREGPSTLSLLSSPDPSPREPTPSGESLVSRLLHLLLYLYVACRTGILLLRLFSLHLNSQGDNVLFLSS